jgi:hypothetical protein
VICLDELGPESAKRYRGRAVVRPAASEPRPAERARQEADDGRRGGGYSFGACRPVSGAALTEPYPGRTTATWLDFLDRVDAWVGPEAETIYAIQDTLRAQRATDVLLWALAHPRWEFVFQPVYAAYLHLIEPWWKVLRSLALTGRRFERWEEICAAVAAATTYWNAHRHPYIWGRRRRHRPRRRAGLAVLPNVA